MIDIVNDMDPFLVIVFAVSVYNINILMFTENACFLFYKINQKKLIIGKKKKNHSDTYVILEQNNPVPWLNF